MKFSKIALSVLAAGLLFAACKNNNVDFKKTPGGMAYKLFPGDGNDTTSLGKVMKVNFRRLLNDSVMFSSYESIPFYIPISGQSQPYDISEIFVGLKKGDSIYAVQ